MKIGCHCGASIVDETDDLPNKGHLIPDQAWFATLDAVDDDVIGPATDGRISRDEACQHARRIIGRAARLTWQCRACGRLYVDGRDGRLRCFVPDGEPIDREILRGEKGQLPDAGPDPTRTLDSGTSELAEQAARVSARARRQADGSKAQLHVRKATASDLPGLLGLYRHLHPHDSPLPPADRVLEVWRDALERTEIFLGFSGNDLVSSCTLVVVPNLTRGAKSYALIENVVTHADHRRRGFGGEIVRHAITKAWAAGCYKVMLLTGSKQEETLRFYETAGLSRDVKTAFVASAPTP